MPAKKPKYSELQVAQALTKANGLVMVAARSLKVAPKTVYEYIKRHPALSDVLQQSRELAIDHVESKLMKAIDEGNVTAMIFFLKTQGKKRGYVERSEHDLNPGNRPVQFTIKMSEGA